MAIFKVTAVPDFSQLKGEIAKLQSSPVTLGVDTRQADVNIKATAQGLQKLTKTFSPDGELVQAVSNYSKRVGEVVQVSRSLNRQSGEMEVTSRKVTQNFEAQAKAAQKAAAQVQAAKEASGFADLMGKSFGKLVTQMALWQVLGNAIAGVKRSFTEALATMKDVDDEMVTIRKVTGATTEELNKIEKQAYETASAYGVAANEYLNSVANFSRAGYGDQASALAELATKTQIVGDTDAETAQQFLLSVDAAYQYQGSIEQLTKVLDGANEIDNKYATSISKIAEGLGKVAPIAAQAHVGVDELTAAIGTITAVTQRSGTEASTALRALFLNIIGDTKTEIDEGVTWTTGEIAGLRDVIKLYAKDAYDAAQATGSVINPMKAIAGLAQSMKDGVLTEQKLMEMVSDIGGKLRTSQLLALIQNWDMYQSMLGDFADAAGSADKEVENALDSWTRKTEILNNKWTQFISHLVETDTIKGALDGVIGLVELLDTDFGRAVVTAGAAAAAFVGVAAAIKAVKKAATALNLASLNPWVLGIMAVGTAIGVVSEATKELWMSYEELDAEIDGNTEKLEANRQKIEEINSLPWAEKTAAILSEREALEAENRELEKQIEHYTKLEAKKAKTELKSANRSVQEDDSNNFVVYSGNSYYSMLTEELRTYQKELEETQKISEENTSQFEQSKSEAAALAAAIDLLGYSSEDVTDGQRAMYDAFMAMEKAYDYAVNATAEYVAGLVEEAAQSGKTEKELYDLVAAQITASNTQLNFSQQIMALQQLAAQAGYAGDALANTFALAGINESNVKRTAEGLLYTGQYSSYEEAYAEALRRAQSAMLYQFGNLTSTAPSGGWGGSASGGSGGGGTGSSSASSKQNELDNAKKKAAQATIDAIKKQMDAETDAIDERIDALKKQNEETERGEKLEELKLNILKKQDELLNARNERTVRQYNAATGQWEWVADAQKVKDAEEALEDAKKDLRDYERDTERELAIEELEARKKAIEAAYQLKIDGWQKFIDELNGDVETEAALLAASLGDWDAYYEEMLKVYQKLLDGMESVTDGEKGYLDESVRNNQIAANEIASAWEEAEERKRKAQASISGAVSGAANPPSDTTPSGGKPLDIDNRKPSGMASDSLGNGGKDYTIGRLTGTRSNSSGSDNSSTKKPSGGNTLGGGHNINKVSRYDSGGILKGMGGIKATVDDEMVLPPDITAKMLRPSANAAFQARMRELGSLYDSAPVSHSLSGVVNNDRHDVTYNYSVNGVTLSPQDANRPFSDVIEFLADAAHHMRPFSGG